MTYPVRTSGGIKTTSDVRENFKTIVELARIILEEIIPQWETDNKFDLFNFQIHVCRNQNPKDHSQGVKKPFRSDHESFSVQEALFNIRYVITKSRAFFKSLNI